jgi:hypothetical protein
MPSTRPGFTALVSKTVARIRARGPGEVIRTWLRIARQLATSNERLIFYHRNLDPESELGEGPPLDGAVFREADVNDAARYARDIGTDSAATFAARLSANTHCFVVVDNETFLHASWVTTAAAWTRELQRYFCPPPNDAYIYESFTRAETRGRGVYPFALRSICGWLAIRELTGVWVGVEDGNDPSLRAVAKAGFRTGFSIDYGRRLGRLTVEQPHGPAAGGNHEFLRTTPDCLREEHFGPKG